MTRDKGHPTVNAAYMASCGLSRPDELYTLPELKRRLGVTDATMRAARRAGLRVYYKHKHGFVFGADVIAYIRQSVKKAQADGGVQN